MPEPAFVPNTVISSSAVNTDFSDIATALTQSVSADGQTPLTGELLGVLGSTATPTWSFNNDDTSGLYLSAAGIPGISAGAGAVGQLWNSAAFTVSGATAATPGTGYAVGDTIVLAGGTGVLPTILTVASLSGSGVATVTILIGGRYAALPASPASQASSSGAGTGATFTLSSGGTTQISTLTGTALWQVMGATPYMAGAMAEPSGLALANYIGAANLAAAISTSLPLPPAEGYLTPVSNTPVIASDSVAATEIYYTPVNGLWAPIHNGTQIIPYQLAGQLPLVLTSSQGADNILDVFLFYNAGSPVIGTGPGWAAGGSGGNITAGSCARSTGTGGAAISRLQGVWTNAQIITLTYNTGAGNQTASVPLNQAIYLGTLYMDHTAGQVTNHVGVSGSTNSQNRKRGLWNAGIRYPVDLAVYDGTASWTYATNTLRASNNKPATWSSAEYNVGSGTVCNGLTTLCGLPEEPVTTSFSQAINANGATVQISIGLNSTSVAFGFSGALVSAASGNETTALYTLNPNLGINTFQAEEASITGNNTYFGTNASMLLQSNWRA